MKKFLIVVGLGLLLCGCDVIDDTIKDAKSTKLGLAKNSVSSYANSVKTAYTEYKYAVALGNYVPNDDSTPVNIDGSVVNLNVKYYGDNIECSSISIVNEAVKLDGCLIYGYEFKYDNGAIQK